MGDGFTIKRDEELDRNYEIWVLVRRSLGLDAFGVNVVELPPGRDIPEHDETERDQEEVFYVLEGDTTLVVDGVDHPAPAGTWARFDPAVRRTVRNDGQATAKVLIAPAPCSSGYEPMGWA